MSVERLRRASLRCLKVLGCTLLVLYFAGLWALYNVPELLKPLDPVAKWWSER